MLSGQPKATDFSRRAPIFDELQPYLEAGYERSELDDDFVVGEYHANANLRTRFHKIFRRAGLEVWSMLLEILRSSRETELLDAYVLGKVCRWFGNSPKVAMAHCDQDRDRDDQAIRAKAA